MQASQQLKKTTKPIVIKSKSNASRSNYRSQRSISPNPYRGSSLQPCESHCFELKPLENSIFQSKYYNETTTIRYIHDDPQLKPYPILLKQFKDEQYLPLFSLQSQADNYRRNLSKYKASFYDEITKVSNSKESRAGITTAVPKHKFCQICKEEFEDYDKHVNEIPHKRIAREAYGTCCITQGISSYTAAIQQQKESEQLQILNQFNKFLDETILLVKRRTNHYKRRMNQ